MDEDYAQRLRNWLRAHPGATPRGTSEERDWLREIPEPASDEHPAPLADPGDRWSVHGQLPVSAADDDWVCPVIALPVPRPSRENGCRMSEAEAGSRWNHPSNARRRAEAPDAAPPDEARSRWNHPSNVDRRAQLPAATPLGEAGSPWNHAEHRAEPPDAIPMSAAEARSRWNHPSNWHRRRREAEQNQQQQQRDEPGSH